MAVYAAHLTRTLQGTPSVFQVVAQDALGATVKPALRKLVEYLAAAHPARCGWALRWFDELYLLFDCCLQHHYLTHYAASFSESFYGLLRVPLSVSGEFSLGQRLPPLLERASLALLVLVPYARDKAERTARRWAELREAGQLDKSKFDLARAAAVRVYAAAHLACEAAALAQLAAYLSGRSASPAPALAALGLALRAAPPAAGEWSLRDVLAGRAGAAALGALALRGVEYGAFAVQFLRWWESRGALADSALPAPPPPQRDELAARCRNRCPLCLQAWRIPTALPVSGYVFCYACISRHVRAHGACPVTRCAAAEASLVRLYVDA